MNKNFKKNVKEVISDYAINVMDETSKTMGDINFSCFKFDMLPNAFTNIIVSKMEEEEPYPFWDLKILMEEGDAKMFENLYDNDESFVDTLRDMFWKYVDKNMYKWGEKISKSYVRDVAFSIKKDDFGAFLNSMKKEYGENNDSKKIFEWYVLHECNGLEDKDCISLVEKFMEEHNDYVERMIAC